MSPSTAQFPPFSPRVRSTTHLGEGCRPLLERFGDSPSHKKHGGATNASFWGRNARSVVERHILDAQWTRIDVCCGSMAILGHGAAPAPPFNLRFVAVDRWMGGGGGGTVSIDLFAAVCGPDRWHNRTTLPYWRPLLE